VGGVANLERGFSLIELIAVLVVLGIVLALAAPRMDGGRSVRELGFTEQLLSDLRLAQRRAEADACEVRVAITPTSVAITQRASLCSGPFNRAVAAYDEAGATLGEAPPEGMPLVSTPSVFYFDGTGRALDSAGGSPVDVSISVGARHLDITGATGYARY
jgi:MSHA pilin protein MshC